MLPAVAPASTVARKILFYSYAMVAATLALGLHSGWLYQCCAAGLGAWFLAEAHVCARLLLERGQQPRP